VRPRRTGQVEHQVRPLTRRADESMDEMAREVTKRLGTAEAMSA
jgi:hypothetical protein